MEETEQEMDVSTEEDSEDEKENKVRKKRGGRNLKERNNKYVIFVNAKFYNYIYFINLFIALIVTFSV